MTNCGVVTLCIGLPGSGKSSWARKYKEDHPDTVIISTDELRHELTGTTKCDPSQNEMIHEAAFERALDIFETPGVQHTVIIDSTNCSLEEWERYSRLPAAKYGMFFPLDVDSAVMRMEKRPIESRVPRDVVQEKYNDLAKALPYAHHYFEDFSIYIPKLQYVTEDEMKA